jgi:DNA (cytosine-5)-methyltransferase 1
MAGKRQATDDYRHLWPEMFRIIGEVQPRWVVAENVLGLLSWKKGLVFEQVQADLEAPGYQVWAYVLPAAGVGAPHRRERIWFVAYANPNPNVERKESKVEYASEESCKENPAGSSQSFRTDRNDHPGKTPRRSVFHKGNTDWSWKGWPSQPVFYRGDDGFSPGLDNITLSRWKEESVSAFGNAIVPQVAYRIFDAIDTFERISLGLGPRSELKY